MEEVRKTDVHEEADLRGTAISVGILFVLILSGFFGSLYLFISRGLTFLAP